MVSRPILCLVGLGLTLPACQWFSPANVPCYGDQHCPSAMECIQSDDEQAGTCEDRSWGGDDDDDDATSGACGSDEIEDCDGHCAPLSWLGDGECDSGQYTWGGLSIDFNCAALSWDAGDCSSGNSGDDDDTVGDDDDTVGDDDDTVPSGPQSSGAYFGDIELTCFYNQGYVHWSFPHINILSGGAWSYGMSSPCPWVSVEVAGNGFNCSFVPRIYVQQGYRISELPPGACGYTEHLLDLPAEGYTTSSNDRGWSCSGANANTVATCDQSVDFTLRMYSSGDPDAQWGWFGWEHLEDTAVVSWP